MYQVNTTGERTIMTNLSIIFNSTSSKGLDSQSERQAIFVTVFEASILSVIIVIAIAGNVLILTAIYRFSSLRTMTNVFVANLALADLLLAVFGMPFTLASSITIDWVFGDVMCKIHGFCNSIFCEASILTLTFVSLERFIAIIYPLKYPRLITPFTMKIMLSFIWVQAAVCASSTPFFSRFEFLEFEHLCVVDWSYKPVYTLTFTLLFFLLPFIVMTIFYGLILRTALRQRKRIADVTLGEIQNEGGCPKKAPKKDDTSNLRKIKKENKATIMIAIVVGTFSVCWFPHAIGVYCLIAPRCNWGSSFYVVTTWLAMLNSALNSSIYGFMNTSFRRAFKSIIFCDRYVSDNDIVTIAGERSRRS